jgi:hypothetical protein
MKPQLAAALALVGWYLMTPPPSKAPNVGWVVSPSDPLNEWRHIASYDTAAECETARDALNKQGWRLINANKDPFSNDAAIGQQDASVECIATDNPRFKGN